MARRKRFRAWGLALLMGAVLSFANDSTASGLGFVAALVVYLLVLRSTRCRVETQKHRPCPWSARGYLGSCKVHLGLKRGLPTMTWTGSFGLPRLMWKRPEGVPTVRVTARPVAVLHEEAATELPARNSMEKTMLGLTVVGVVIALAAFIRDVVAG